MEIKDFPKLPLATSFVLETLDILFCGSKEKYGISRRNKRIASSKI